MPVAIMFVQGAPIKKQFTKRTPSYQQWRYEELGETFAFYI